MDLSSPLLAQASKLKVNNESPSKRDQVKRMHPYALKLILQGRKKEAIEYLEKISEKIDIVDIFRPSKEAPVFAKDAVKIGAKTLWLQYGIHNDEAKKISENSNIKYVSDKCIKQEYQKLFQKSHPVFPVLRDE